VQSRKPILSLPFPITDVSSRNRKVNSPVLNGNYRQAADSKKTESLHDIELSKDITPLICTKVPPTQHQVFDSSSDSLFKHADKEKQPLDSNIDVTDLDDSKWTALSESKKIHHLGSLGEGASGSVTKCILEGGSTVFAVKVSWIFLKDL
jgi:hypothetical protein